eukprot:12105007-Karenia_brevis.AAC.1
MRKLEAEIQDTETEEEIIDKSSPAGVTPGVAAAVEAKDAEITSKPASQQETKDQPEAENEMPPPEAP